MSDLRAHNMGDGFDPNDALPEAVTNSGATQFGDVSTPLYDATITGTGTLPNDSTIDDEGPADIPLPTPDYSLTDPQVDGVEAQLGSDVMPGPPPGSYTGHVDIGDDESLHNMLSGRQFTMRGDDD